MNVRAAVILLPGPVRSGYLSLFRYTGRQDPLQATGVVSLATVLGALAAAMVPAVLFSLPGAFFVGLFLLLFLLFHLIVAVKLWFSVEGKAHYVDTVLPDALRLMSMNIRSGETTDRAVLMAARPEFGPLEEGLKRVAKDVLSGRPIRQALLSMTTTIRSKTLERAIRLIVEGIESGGELAHLLDQTADDIQKTALLEKEVSATVMMYAIFIFFAAGIGAPLIFGISTHLVGVLSELSRRITVTSLGDIAGAPSFVSLTSGGAKISVSNDFLNLYAILSLIITSFFGGLIIGLIKDGKEKSGFKYIPILLFLSLALFLIVKYFIAGMVVV